MAASIVQLVVPSGGWFGSFASPVTSGNSVIAVATGNALTGPSATFNSDAMTTVDMGVSTGLSQRFIYFYRHNHTSGGTQIVTSATGGQVAVVRMYELSGLDALAPEVSRLDTGSGSSSATSGSYTFSSGSAGFTWLQNNSGATTTGPTSWTFDGAQVSAWYGGQASRIFPSGSTTSHSFPLPGTATWDIATAIFKIPGASNQDLTATAGILMIIAALADYASATTRRLGVFDAHLVPQAWF